MRLLEREDYERFVSQFSESMQAQFSQHCVYGYGSYRSDIESFRPNSSDHDGGMIFDSGIVTPKDGYREIAALFAEACAGKPLDIQLNVNDRVSASEGRFLPYGKRFAPYVRDKSVVLSGPDYLSHLHGVEHSYSILFSALEQVEHMVALYTEVFPQMTDRERGLL